MHTPHSGMGIAAFITALCGAVLMLGLIVIAGIIETTTPGGMEETSMSAILVGLGLMCTALMQLVALPVQCRQTAAACSRSSAW